METSAFEDSTPARELARNLPELVTQLQALRQDMERQSKLYDSLLGTVDGSRRSSIKPPTSIFTPFANAQLDPRASQMSLEDLIALDKAVEDTNYTNTLVSRQSSMMMRQKEPSYGRQSFRRPQSRASNNNLLVARMDPDTYSVIWVSGECGISLRNFSRNGSKVGAQIAVLQHADGVTTGISKCRLGDQLVSLNDEHVESLTFREIVDKLKTTRRPISLGFRTNANVCTSPKAAASVSRKGPTKAHGETRRFFSRSGPSKKIAKETLSLSTVDDHLVNQEPESIGPQQVDDEERTDFVDEDIDHLIYEDIPSDRRSGGEKALALALGNTTLSDQSTCTLSDDIEVWCREQEEMHSHIIVLLTETILRCEKLQQENLDQLQNLMQLSASSSPL